jgi:hypothetical protein
MRLRCERSCGYAEEDEDILFDADEDDDEDEGAVEYAAAKDREEEAGNMVESW